MGKQSQSGRRISESIRDNGSSGVVTLMNTIELPSGLISEIKSNLSTAEQDVIYLWLGGKPKYEAWVTVMRPGLEITSKNYKSIRTQSSRFWSTKRINDIVSAVEDWRADQRNNKTAKFSDNTKETTFEPSSQTDASTSQNPSASSSDAAPDIEASDKSAERPTQRPTPTLTKKRSYEEQRRAWVESFNDIENPTPTTAYGLGLYLGQRVLAQINKREQYIARNGISPIDKDGCPYTNVDVSAIKTVLAALLPFAPAPTQQELKQLTTAGLIISLTAEEMGINPDEYVAPTPPGVRPATDEVVDTTAETQNED